MDVSEGGVQVATIERPVLPPLPPVIRARRPVEPTPPTTVTPPLTSAPAPTPPTEIVAQSPVEFSPHAETIAAPEAKAPKAPKPPKAKKEKKAKAAPKLGPTPKRSGVSARTKRTAVLIAVLLVGAVAGGGFYLSKIIAGTTLVTNLETGQCIENFFQESEQEFVELFAVTTTDCTNPHAYEVYDTTDAVYAGGAYPGVEEAFRIGEQHCLAEYDRFVGGDYQTSRWEFWTFVPTPDRWDKDDRVVQCMVGEFDQNTLTTGTLRGAGR